MIKNFIVFALFLPISIATAQESIRFDIKVSSNKKYISEIVNSSLSEIHLIADKATMDKIKSSGIELPILMEQETDISLINITGDKLESGELPVELEYGKMITKTIVNGKSSIEEKPYSGMKIFGRYNTHNKFVVDTITGENVTQEMKEVLVSTLENIQEQIKFPEGPINVGDKFDSEMPLTIPVKGMDPIKINLIIEYELKEIIDNRAYLDLQQSVTLDLVQKQLNVEASGIGNGTSEYDIKENYLIKYQSELPMDITIKMNDSLSMKMHTTTKSYYNVTIE